MLIFIIVLSEIIKFSFRYVYIKKKINARNTTLKGITLQFKFYYHILNLLLLLNLLSSTSTRVTCVIRIDTCKFHFDWINKRLTNDQIYQFFCDGVYLSLMYFFLLKNKGSLSEYY